MALLGGATASRLPLPPLQCRGLTRRRVEFLKELLGRFIGGPTGAMKCSESRGSEPSGRERRREKKPQTTGRGGASRPPLRGHL